MADLSLPLIRGHLLEVLEILLVRCINLIEGRLIACAFSRLFTRIFTLEVSRPHDSNGVMVDRLARYR